MKVTKMRVNGAVPSTDVVLKVERELKAAFHKAGFITDVTLNTRTSLKIGLHMCSFRIDTGIHGYNARYNPYMKYKAGYKRTSTPTWDQRVEFNDIVNKVLDKNKISASIKSGPFIIRQGSKAMTENDWHNQKPSYLLENEARGFSVESLAG